VQIVEGRDARAKRLVHIGGRLVKKVGGVLRKRSRDKNGKQDETEHDLPLYRRKLLALQPIRG
jgi:hypothetical protein